LQTDLSLRRSDWDWARTIEIIELIESRVSGYVEGWNFNRYGQKNGTLRVALRLNVPEANIQNVQDALNIVKSEGKILDFRPHTQPWSEPHFVVIGHEFGTESALKFKQKADESEDIQRIMGLRGLEFHNIASFFYCLLRLLAENMGFKIPRLWEYERHSSIRLPVVKQIAQFCVPQGAQESLESIEKNDRGSFLERYIHCFFNCISRQYITVDQHISLEGHVKRRLLDSILWEHIGEA